MPLCALAGRNRIVVAVVPSDAVGWYMDHGLLCDFEVQLGRIDYDPPPGITITSGNERCSSLLVWWPESRTTTDWPAKEMDGWMGGLTDDRAADVERRRELFIVLGVDDSKRGETNRGEKNSVETKCQATIGAMILPWTSVSRKSRPE